MIQHLESNLFLCYTGITRSASSVLMEQKKLMNQDLKRAILDKMVSMVGNLKDELEKGRID